MQSVSLCQMMMPGKDFLRSHVLSWWRKVYSDREDVTSSGRAFQIFGPTGKAQWSTLSRRSLYHGLTLWFQSSFIRLGHQAASDSWHRRPYKMLRYVYFVCFFLLFSPLNLSQVARPIVTKFCHVFGSDCYLQN